MEEERNNFDSFHSVLSQSNPIDPDNVIKNYNSSIQQSANVNRNRQLVFIPKRNLFYCYFTERNSRNQNFIIKNAIDIQRSCCYPKTSNVYTFIGFSNQKQRDQATCNRKLINLSNNQIIYKFVQNFQEILNFYQKENNQNQQSDANKAQEEKNTKEFSPKEKLIYFYFREPKKTDAERLRDLNHPIYHIFNTSDVQLYRYYPGTKKIYSFFGFLNKEEGIRSFKSSRIVLQNYRIKIISNSKLNHIQQKVDFNFFHPIDNLFYFFFVETQQPSIEYANFKYDRLFGINNATDIQRFCYHPKTKEISTFIGFADQDKLNQAIKKPSLKLAAIKQQIQLYSIENRTTKNENKNINENEDNKSSNIDTREDIDENEAKTNIYNTNKNNNALFKPNYDLYYVYFKENNFNKDQQFLDIDDIQDIQRNRKINRKESIYFTFLGFINSIHRAYAIKALQIKTEEIDINSIKNFDEDYFSDNEYDEEEKIKNQNLLNSQFQTSPNSNTNNSNDKFHFTPLDLQYDSNSNDNLVNSQPNATPKDKSKSTTENEQKPSISLPTFNDYKNSGIRFKSFIPKENLFYCFLAEINKPSRYTASKKYTKLFGITDASDIQRFFFYPETENVYSFLGFSDQPKLERAVKQSSFKSAAIGGKIYSYPYILDAQKSKDDFTQNKGISNQPSVKISKKKNKKLLKNKFVYIPETDDCDKMNEKVELGNRNDNSIYKSDNYDAIFNDDEITDNKNDINNNNDDDDSYNNDNDDRFTNNDTLLNDNDDENHNEKELFFDQNEDLYYLYFKENEPKIKNYRTSDTELFNISNIKDLQRGFKHNETDPNYYTFFGFVQTIELSNAFKILQEKNNVIDVSSVQIINNDEYNDVEDDEYEDGGYESNDCEDGDEDIDFDFDDVEYPDEGVQSVHRTDKIIPEEKIHFTNK